MSETEPTAPEPSTPEPSTPKASTPESAAHEPVAREPVATEAPAKKGSRGGRTIGILIVVIGAIFLIAGVSSYVLVSNTLADEKITVSEDAKHFGGDQVKGPFTAYYQADIIATHAKEIADGKTYAELPQDDPRRDTVMNASFLRASLFTSIVAFGVAAFVAVMGIILILIGFVLARLSKAAAA